jgi:predicted transport protein
MTMATPEEMAAKMVANLKEKTGRTLDQWLKITRASKLEKHGQLVAHLKSEHGIGHGFANLIAHESLSPGELTSDDLVAAQYSGKKANLRPINEALLKAIKSLGKDIAVAPKKTYVSLRRNKQFALIQPSTATRLDLGLNLNGEPTTDRLEASGSFNSMCSHRVRLGSAADIDLELKSWLRKAYMDA